VMALEDVMVTKLCALTEHSLRYEGLLSIARALREQIDWRDVHRRCDETAFARAFFVLLDGLGIVPAAEFAADEDEDEPAHGSGASVRVLNPGA
jgi:hypothetical protein